MTKLYEVETKRKLTFNKKLFVTSLLSQGYTENPIFVEVDDYYSRPDVDYMKTVECLRIRRTDNTREITYKPPTTDFSATTIIKEEKNVALAKEIDVEIARDLLLAIGMIHLVTVEKHRQTYERAYRGYKITITIDYLLGVGNFVEVEILSKSPDDAKKMIVEVENLLGLDKMPLVTEPYRDMVMKEQHND